MSRPWLIMPRLKAAGVARGGKDGVRLLGKGELTAKIKLQRRWRFCRCQGRYRKGGWLG